MSLNFKQTQPQTKELTVLERLEKSAYTYNDKAAVTSLAPSFLDGSSQVLQITRITIKAGTSFIFGHVQFPNT